LMFDRSAPIISTERLAFHMAKPLSALQGPIS
jgi:hypothetical protein